jgi:hypothetical protein
MASSTFGIVMCTASLPGWTNMAWRIELAIVVSAPSVTTSAKEIERDPHGKAQALRERGRGGRSGGRRVQRVGMQGLPPVILHACDLAG